MSDQITYAYQTLHTAVLKFLEAYLQPQVPKDCILGGSEQNMVLPEGEDYVIFQITQQIRHGTTTEKYDPQKETLTLKEVNEIVVKVDCYADSTNSDQDSAILRAQIRANNLNLLFRSSVAVEFFKAYNISALYADDAQDTTVISDSNQYLKRWSVNLHLGLANSLTLPQPGFTEMPIVFNQLITKAEAEQDPVKAAKLHVADVDVKLK